MPGQQVRETRLAGEGGVARDTGIDHAPARGRRQQAGPVLPGLSAGAMGDAIAKSQDGLTGRDGREPCRLAAG